MSMEPGTGDSDKRDPGAQPHRQPTSQTMPGYRLQKAALWANVVMAASVLVTALFGVWTYSRNADAQVQLLALGTLQHYLDLAVEHPELASRDNDRPIDAQYG
jgi:negative regulator of sigma E activity